MNYNVGFMGLGKLGLPCALAMEDIGHKVLGFDPSLAVAEILKTRHIPYKEVGTSDLIKHTEIKLVGVETLVRHSELVFIAVQTPHHPMYEGVTRVPKSRENFDYSHLCDAVTILSHEAYLQKKNLVVVIISTVLPGTISTLIEPKLNKFIQLVYNPFFIAMGTTIPDFINPEFVLVGSKEKVSILVDLYSTIHNRPIIQMSIPSAELTKVAYNTFITSKICITNTLMEICDKVPEADIDEVMGALKSATQRVTSPLYMDGGMGDGGGCHPRDNIAMSWLSQHLEIDYDWFGQLMRIREKQAEWLASVVIEYSLFYGLPIIILGKSFKPGTNLIVGSPAMLVRTIIEEKMKVHAHYDPEIDSDPPDIPAVYLIATKHEFFVDFNFPCSSVVVDPHRYIPDNKDTIVHRLGARNRGSSHPVQSPKTS